MPLTFYRLAPCLISPKRYRNQATFLTGNGIKYSREGIYNFKNHTSLQKVKIMNHFMFPSFYFGILAPKIEFGDGHGNSLVVRRVSPGRIVVVLF